MPSDISYNRPLEGRFAVTLPCNVRLQAEASVMSPTDIASAILTCLTAYVRSMASFVTTPDGPMSKREIDNAAVVKTACALLVGILIFGFATHKDKFSETSNVSKPTQTAADAAVTNGATRPSMMINDRVAIAKPCFSCASQDDLDKIKKLALIDNDAKAAAVYGVAHNCSVQKEGAVFKVERMSAWHGSICIREMGDPECTWFPEQLLIKTI